MAVSTEQNYSRVAKNTLVLYLRMLLTMGITFYTTRITLEALGVDDYGIYNVLGGVVAMLSILTGSLSVAISRFITIEIGRDNIERLRLIFSSSIIVMSIIAFFIAIIAEVAGIWFINNKMSIPPDKIFDAHWALQCFIISFCLNLICIPYNAAVVAHERMSAFAVITIINTMCKLGVAFLLFLSDENRLIYYAVYIVAIDLANRIIYGIYCNRNFPEATFSWTLDKSLIKEMGKFTGWAFLGNGAVVLKDQGVNVIINVFCGLVVNAARGISLQVAGALEALVNNFMMAVTPQITKAYANHDLSYMHSLIMKSAKFSFFIFFIFAFPIAINIDYILSWWLVDVPEYTAPFVVWSLIYCLLNCLCVPILTGILAEGNIKTYEIAITIIYVGNFAAAYLLLALGFSPVSVMIANAVVKALILGLLMGYANKRFKLSIGNYLKTVILPISIVCLLSCLFWRICTIPMPTNFLGLTYNVAIYFAVALFATAFLGLNKKERVFIKSGIASKLNLKAK